MGVLRVSQALAWLRRVQNALEAIRELQGHFSPWGQEVYRGEPQNSTVSDFRLSPFKAEEGPDSSSFIHSFAQYLLGKY